MESKEDDNKKYIWGIFNIYFSLHWKNHEPSYSAAAQGDEKQM